MQLKNSPRLGCAVVIRDRNKILLGVRGKERNKGKWILPGGGVEFLEPMHQTAKREILEETGLEVQLRDTIGVYEIINSPHEHRVIVYWWADCAGGTLRPSSDLLEARFLSRREVRALIDQGLASDIVSRVLKDIGWS